MLLWNIGVLVAIFSLIKDCLILDEQSHVEQVDVLIVIEVLLLGASWLDVFDSVFHLPVCHFLNKLKFVVECFDEC